MSSSSLCLTYGTTRAHTLNWEISNLANLHKVQSDHKVLSIVQVTDPTARFEIKIRFPHDKDDILECLLKSPEFACVNCVLIVADAHTEFLRIEKDIPAAKPEQWHYLGTVKRNVLLNKTGRGLLRCDIKFKTINMEFNVEDDNDPGVQLMADFRNLLNEALYSDVIVKSAEGDEFKAHKAVLASRSDVLKAHFQYKNKECQTNTVECPIDSEVLKEVLAFIYTDQAPRLHEIPGKLLAAADYFQLSRLKSLCEQELISTIDVKNAVELLQFADLYSANTLKESILKFIKNIQMSSIIKTEGWLKLKSVDLAKTLCEYAFTPNDKDTAHSTDKHIFFLHK